MAKKVKKKVVNQPIERAWCGMECDEEAGVGLHVAEQGEACDFFDPSVGSQGRDRVWAKAVYSNKDNARKRYQCVRPYLLVPNTLANRRKLGIGRKK
jgi:hypothetical protein